MNIVCLHIYYTFLKVVSCVVIGYAIYQAHECSPTHGFQFDEFSNWLSMCLATNVTLIFVHAIMMSLMREEKMEPTPSLRANLAKEAMVYLPHSTLYVAYTVLMIKYNPVFHKGAFALLGPCCGEIPMKLLIFLVLHSVSVLLVIVYGNASRAVDAYEDEHAVCDVEEALLC